MRRTKWLASGVLGALLVTVGMSAVAVAQSEAPASPAASTGAVACGEIPPTLPTDNTGLLAALPQETLAGYYDYPRTIDKSPYETYQPTHAAPWKIGHLGNFVGNDWHVIQLAQFAKTAQEMKDAGLISDFEEVHADNDIQTQIQQFRQMEQDGVDAVVLEPVSATGLVDEINAAKALGMVVVTQDSPAETLNAVNVGGNPVLYGAEKARLLVEAMGGKGNAVMVSGIQGNPANAFFDQGAQLVFANCPDVHVDTIYGQWDVATAKSEMLKYLTTHPGNVDGVWESSGMGKAVVDAFIQAGRAVPPVINGDPDINYLAYWRDNQANGFKGGAAALPSASGADAAMRVALKILQGQGVKVSDIPAAIPVVTADNLNDWVDPSWTPDSPGMTDRTVGTYLGDDILAPLFDNPAPTIPGMETPSGSTAP
jgi:ribose transport system substrate-binding protein